MDDIVKKISYKPDIKYTDEYKSDIIFNNTNKNNIEIDSEEDTTVIDDLINQGNSLQSMIDKLPGSISDTIKDTVDPIIDFVKDELKDKVLDRVPVQIEWDYNFDPSDDDENENSNDEDNDEDDDDGLWDDDDEIPIKKEYHTLEEIIQKEYVKNLYDLFEDYYNNLRNIVYSFWSTILTSVRNKENDEIEMIINNILLSSSEIKDDKKHLLDLAVKSEINRNMKLQYYGNNFNAEGSIKHLKHFKAVYELRLRYSKIPKNENPKTRSDQMSNNMLKSMNLAYSAKYDKAYENLYRYLKSSNVILEDSLRSAAQSIKAKQTLIDTKGVK